MKREAMTCTVLAVGLMAALPSSAAADDLLDRLSAATWGDAPRCSSTLRIVSDENGEIERRAYRIDAETMTTTMIEGPPEEMAAIEAKAASQAAGSQDQPPDAEGQNGLDDGNSEGGGDGDGDGDGDGEVSVSMGFTPYQKASLIDGFGYVRLDDVGGLAVYRSDSLPKKTFRMSGRDFSKRSSAMLYVDDTGAVPRVVRRVIALEKPVRVPLIAKVRTLREENAYEIVGGVPSPVLMAFAFDADVMGDDMVGTVTMTMGEHDCAPAPAAKVGAASD